MQLVVAAAEEYVPAAHLVQIATDGAPDPEENLPGIHGVQLLVATAEEYVPAAHGLHCHPPRGAEALITFTRPGKHVQLVPCSHAAPAGQMHCSTVLAPG